MSFPCWHNTTTTSVLLGTPGEIPDLLGRSAWPQDRKAPTRARPSKPGRYVRRLSPYADQPANRLEEPLGVVARAVAEHRCDLFDRRRILREIALDDEQVRLLAGGNRPDTLVDAEDL